MSRGERGFDAFRKVARKKEKFLASCQSCVFMEDECINSNVTSFDMVITETNRYCTFWKGYMSKERYKDEE